MSIEEPYSEAKEEQTVNEDETNTNQSDEESSIVIHRSEFTGQRPDYYGTWIYTAKEQGKEPVTVEEAMPSPEKEKWKDATEEIRSIKVNEGGSYLSYQRIKTLLGANGSRNGRLALMGLWNGTRIVLLLKAILSSTD